MCSRAVIENADKINNKINNNIDQFSLYLLKPKNSKKRIISWLTKFIAQVYFRDYSVFALISDPNLIKYIDNKLWVDTNKFVPHHCFIDKENLDIKDGSELSSPIVLTDNILDKKQISSFELRTKKSVLVFVYDLCDISKFGDNISNLKNDILNNIKIHMELLGESNISRISVVIFGLPENQIKQETLKSDSKSLVKDLQDMFEGFKNNNLSDIFSLDHNIEFVSYFLI